VADRPKGQGVGPKAYQKLVEWFGPDKAYAMVVQRRRKHHPKRAGAHHRVREGLRRGLLSRPPRCEVCGRECKVIAHHEDYDKPLEVEWLCRACHAKRHPFPPVDNRNA